MPRTVKVAVIGSGLAGLTAAHLLTKPCQNEDIEFEVHLFEKSDTIGMDSSSISLSLPSLKQDWRVDVPMRSFQGGYYTHLIYLYRSLGVTFRVADFSYSFSSLSSAFHSPERSITTTLIYNGQSGRAGISRPVLFHPPFFKKSDGKVLEFIGRCFSNALYVFFALQILLLYLYTLFDALPIRRGSDNRSFYTWTNHKRPTSALARLMKLDSAWDNYVETVLIPLFSAVCTAPREDILLHPVEEFLDYIWLTFGTHHYVVNGGVRQVTERLTTDIQHIHLCSPASSIVPDAGDPRCVTIRCSNGDGEKEYIGFHHVIFAAQANTSATVLSSYLDSLPAGSTTQKDQISRKIHCLKAFQYRRTMVINHTDDSLLPDYDEDVRELNLVSSDDWADALLDFTQGGTSYLPETYIMATQILPRPADYPESQPTVFQTTNPIVPIRKECILSSATLERAIVTEESKIALKDLVTVEEPRWWQTPYKARTHLGPLQGIVESENGTGPGLWFCGAYAHSGIPLLEGCVISARTVVEEGILASEGTRWRKEPWMAKRTFLSQWI